MPVEGWITEDPSTNRSPNQPIGVSNYIREKKLKVYNFYFFFIKEKFIIRKQKLIIWVIRLFKIFSPKKKRQFKIYKSKACEYRETDYLIWPFQKLLWQYNQSLFFFLFLFLSFCQQALYLFSLFSSSFVFFIFSSKHILPLHLPLKIQFLPKYASNIFSHTTHKHKPDGSSNLNVLSFPFFLVNKTCIKHKKETPGEITTQPHRKASS